MGGTCGEIEKSVYLVLLLLLVTSTRMYIHRRASGRGLAGAQEEPRRILAQRYY